MYSILGLGIVLIVWALLNLTDNMMQVEAKKQGVDTKNNNFSLFPSIASLLGGAKPSRVGGDPYYKLSRGHNIKLEGEADTNNAVDGSAVRYAVRPPEYRGIAPIPKLMVAEGDEVKAGDPVFFDKSNPDIKYSAPVSGEVVEVRRGAKRAITEVIILADKEQAYRKYDVPGLDSDKESLVSFLCDSGFWPLINKRPFDVIADPAVSPKNIFISTFDSAPLAADSNLIVSGNEELFAAGLKVLNQLTDGKVHLGINGRKGAKVSDAFAKAEGVDRHWFDGPHPSGNVGVQIHHIDPILTNDVVWTLKVQDVITLGELFTSGKFAPKRVVAVTGVNINKPHYIRTAAGANIGELLKGNLDDSAKARIIDGNVLTGRTVTGDDFLNSGSSQITVVNEGDYYEIFGWLLPIKPRPTISRSFPNFLFPKHKFIPDTNTHGEKRAFVVTGQYESVLPMDVYPQHIMKAIMTNDFERMDGLGLAELSEEDVALCEFTCTSKMPLQNILRQGLDMLREQS
ncbi:MAG: Na(+)-translocating NADH-quinone reductase subunit A [Saprospiraceae bacterium]|nr:Na(+)-translocating NADH-quinone reductase subunit A [Saprospiraceae bacterium]